MKSLENRTFHPLGKFFCEIVYSPPPLGPCKLNKVGPEVEFVDGFTSRFPILVRPRINGIIELSTLLRTFVAAVGILRNKIKLPFES